jgi:hypothetical protein
VTTPVTTWRYHLPSTSSFGGWAIVFLDSIGCFSALSDYGDYGYRWPEAGWGPGDFRAFLAGRDPRYVLGKIARRDHYDGDATLRAVKEQLCELRRHGSWKRERAREEWDLLALFDGLATREDFGRWYDRTRLDEAYEFSVFTHPPRAQAFMENVFPRLQAAIREELEREKGRAA